MTDTIESLKAERDAAVARAEKAEDALRIRDEYEKEVVVGACGSVLKAEFAADVAGVEADSLRARLTRSDELLASTMGQCERLRERAEKAEREATFWENIHDFVEAERDEEHRAGDGWRKLRDHESALWGEKVRELQAEVSRLTGETERLTAAAEAGWELSTVAAAIRWDGEGNTPEWLSDLRECIEKVQALYEGKRSAMKQERPVLPGDGTVKDTQPPCATCGDTGWVPCPYLNATARTCHYPGSANTTPCPSGSKGQVQHGDCTIPCPECGHGGER